MKNKILILLIVFATITTAQDKSLKITTSDNAVITIPIKNNTTLSVETATGNVLTTTSLDKSNFSAATGGNCSSSNQGTAAPVVTLSANPATVTVGATSTITYNISNVAATSCTKSGAWSGTISGSTNLSIGAHNLSVNPTQSSTYKLQCFNNSNASNIAQTTVTINTGNSNCPSPVVSTEDTSPDSLQTALNASLFSFPYTNTSNTFSITKNEYVALNFTTSNGQQRWKFISESPNTNPSKITVAISECPGVFDQANIVPNCFKTGTESFSQMVFSTIPGEAQFGFCELDINKNYYMNIIHAREDLGGYSSTGCPYASCEVLMNSRPF